MMHNFGKLLKSLGYSTIVAPIIIISIRIIPKNESAKQKEKQQEERELNRLKEAWAMYQKVINDDDE